MFNGSGASGLANLIQTWRTSPDGHLPNIESDIIAKGWGYPAPLPVFRSGGVALDEATWLKSWHFPCCLFHSDKLMPCSLIPAKYHYPAETPKLNQLSPVPYVDGPRTLQVKTAEKLCSSF